MPVTSAVRADTTQERALVLKAVTKSFDRIAVDGLDLSIAAGEFYALLGPNGAGKTTTLRMVAGLLRPDAGSISIFGTDALSDPIAAKRLIAWVPDVPLIYDKLTPAEYLEFVAGLWSVEPARAEAEAERLFRLLDLSEHRDQRCEALSHGTRQKVVLAGALIHGPRLLILDEPLTGLDAATARQVKDLLHARVREGASVIMSTHILDVAERTASRIGIIQSGRIRAEGTFEELQAQAGLGDSTLEDVFLELTSHS
ncbi:MAG: ABC transporter ATP-binding protein [Alphaproteobacteria bacterium]|nr:ABC transporter ATP-binding protein [Alphaproteobacteria bacterium]